MKSVSNLATFWQSYFAPVSDAVFDTWTIAHVAQDGASLFVSLADPLTERAEEVLIKQVGDGDVQTFLAHYRERFLQQLPQRFNFLRPDVNKVLTEYPNWQEFSHVWLTDNAVTLQRNVPLLFDFPSADDYRAMQLRQADYAGYRRLLVVVFQYRKQTFQRFFINDVDDAQYAQIIQNVTNTFQKAVPLMWREPIRL